MLEVTPVNAFADNYLWLIHSPLDRRRVAVVDPGDAAPVRRALQDNGLSLGAILVTHHHPDHTGGVAELAQQYAVPVFAPAGERIPAATTRLVEGESATLADLQLTFRVLQVPGHTAGHIAYVGHGALFCGDTLFSAGCGRLFEGTAEQMTQSLRKLKTLDADTAVYCAHEYTLSNLRFAAAVEPANADIRAHQAWCEQQRAQGRPTLPSNIRLELKINPFLRCTEESVKQAAVSHAGQPVDSESQVFSIVRRWKDTYRG